jgi:hypothetical protein
MAFTKSGWYLNTFMAFLKATAQTGGTLALTGQDAATYLSLQSNAGTDGTAPLNFSAASPAWANTNEVTGTGWATGGVQTSVAASGGTNVTSTLAEGTAGSVRYSWTNPLAVAGTTLTNIFGCIIYHHSITAPVNLPMILCIAFGSGYNTVAGVFGITPSGTGLSEIDLTP